MYKSTEYKKKQNNNRMTNERKAKYKPIDTYKFFVPCAANCRRALARQHPILYNSEKKAKSFGCKIEDMRSRLFFISGHSGVLCECTWKYRSISSNSPAQLEIKGTINEVKYG